MLIDVTGSTVIVVVACTSSPAVAVTTAVAAVFNTVRALPPPSVVAELCCRMPALDRKVTGTRGSGFWALSRTVAVTVAAPPLGGRLVGCAVMRIAPTAAAPMVTFTVSVAASPENARRSATPDAAPAVNVALARPRTVATSAGWIVPRLAENVTTVPSCTGVPAGSTTCAVTDVEPPTGTMLAPATSVSVDRVGATNGTESHAALHAVTATSEST